MWREEKGKCMISVDYVKMNAICAVVKDVICVIVGFELIYFHFIC